ncbi:FG-GAP repeat domain-containing protein [Spirosoma foliorum]|uniref:VCBS repeat-containing protein n=1 Tax=Spirosoma foliorum TaxID=2710596 RepID=A0A7G5GP21_9BACT|nr:VCBS repeat-containing protein [Spirosoma foliorum]QMW00613.1 VCBS repeat-containing protein [Spirosoma foliorum]
MNTTTNIISRHILSGLLALCWIATAYGQEKSLFNVRQQQATNAAANVAKSTKPVVPDGDFKKTTITRDFISEGVAVADLNKDGKMDIVAGYYWFEAPNWTRHEMAPSRVFDPRKEYSESFLNLGMDVNLDGWDDVVIIDFPGKPAFWFENPKTKTDGAWKKHILADSVGIANESPGFIDIDGDGRLDILCGDKAKKQIIWLKPPVKPGDTEWQRFALSQENVPGTETFSHGIGFGDINKDGFNDVVVREGWFEGTADKKSANWVFHPADIGEPCSHMQILDVNGDGKNDVVSASAHALGIWWHEQVMDEQGKINFKTHLMSNTTAQTHSSIMTDLNGDGRKDYITGKRFLAHHGRDPGDSDPGILLWFEFTPGKAPYYKEHVIDNDSGAGLNIVTHDMNGDKKPDIVIANKNGVFLFENKVKK